MQANSILSKCIEIEPFGIRFGIRSSPWQQRNEKGFGPPLRRGGEEGGYHRELW